MAPAAPKAPKAVASREKEVRTAVAVVQRFLTRDDAGTVFTTVIEKPTAAEVEFLRSLNGVAPEEDETSDSIMRKLEAVEARGGGPRGGGPRSGRLDVEPWMDVRVVCQVWE